MIGPTDALHQPFDILWCPHLDHQINISPIKPQVQGTCADNRTQSAGNHSRLNPLALRSRQRAVVDCDGQVVLVELPKFMKKYLGLCPRVVKNQDRVVLRHLLQHLRDCIARPAARPRGWRVNLQHRYIRQRTLWRFNNMTRHRMAGHKARNLVRFLHRGR